MWREGRRGGRRGYMPTGGLAGSRGARLAGSRGARPPKYGGLLPHAAQSMHPEGSYPPPCMSPPLRPHRLARPRGPQQGQHITRPHAAQRALQARRRAQLVCGGGVSPAALHATRSATLKQRASKARRKAPPPPRLHLQHHTRPRS